MALSYDLLRVRMIEAGIPLSTVMKVLTLATKDDLLSLSQVEREYGIHRMTLYKWIARDRLHVVERLGKVAIVSRTEIELLSTHPSRKSTEDN